MKYLILDTSKEFRGGQQQICYLAPGLIQKGLDITVCVRDGSLLNKKLAELGTPTVSVQPLFEGSPSGTVKLAGLIKNHGFSLLNAQSSHDHTLAWFASKLIRPKPALVVTRRVDFAPGSSFFNRRKYLHGANHYIAISGAIGDVLAAGQIPREKISVVHSSVETAERVPNARAEIIDELSLPADSILIGDIASLVDHKGHTYLLKAFPKVLKTEPRARLLLAGRGDLRHSLEREAADLGISDQVHFLGQREDVPRLHCAFDLFVMTSHLEGLCTSILDAMSARTPVVATSAGGIPEIVRHGQTGLLADSKSPESIAANILKTLKDREITAQRIERAFQMVETEFGVKKMVDRTAAIYRQLTDS